MQSWPSNVGCRCVIKTKAHILSATHCMKLGIFIYGTISPLKSFGFWNILDFRCCCFSHTSRVELIFFKSFSLSYSWPFAP